MTSASDDSRASIAAPTAGASLGAAPAPAAHTLPIGTRLKDYQIDGVIGEGGFGIVYLATDVALERRIAIKEYLPSSMASRLAGSLTVVVHSASHRETFELGKDSFVKEAKLLAHFDHPALVKVHRYWEENDTAYMVMPYYVGPTLKRTLADLGRPPGEAEVMAWLAPLMAALEVLHHDHCYHRDIAPDNILITTGGPLLLDFGAARRVIGDMTHALTVILKPGYAPIEQYGEIPGMTQGAWTDIYALASVLYMAITGRKPVASVERLIEDRLRPASEVAADRYSPRFLAAIDAALALYPKQRPQTIAEFRALLGMAPPEVQATSSLALLAPPPAPAPPPRPQPPPSPTAPPPPGPVPQTRLVQPPQAPPSRAAAPSTSVPMPAPVSAAAPAAPAQGLRNAVIALLAAAAAAAVMLVYRHRTEAGAEPTVAVPTPAPKAQAPVALPPVARPAPPPAAATEAPASVAAPAPTPTPAPRAKRPPPPAAPPARRPSPQDDGARATSSAATRARCSDILQKASLEPLTPSESAFMQRECR